MIKHQILIIFICIVVVAWLAYTVKERRRIREKQDQKNGNDFQNKNL